jgi:hypothetical protein
MSGPNVSAFAGNCDASRNAVHFRGNASTPAGNPASSHEIPGAVGNEAAGPAASADEASPYRFCRSSEPVLEGVATTVAGGFILDVEPDWTV